MEYHSDRFKDASYLILKKNNVVAVLPANSVGDTIHSHQGLSYGGLILKPSLKLNEVILIFEALLNQLAKDGFKTLDLKFIPDFYALQSTDELKYLTHILHAELYKRDVLSVLNLRCPLPYNSSTKQAIKQAEALSLEVKEVEEVKSFWNELLIPNLEKRHQARPVHSVSEMEKLKQQFPSNIRQFNVYNNKL